MNIHISRRVKNIGVSAAVATALLLTPLVGFSQTGALSADNDSGNVTPVATCAVGNPLSAYQPKEVTPETQVEYNNAGATNTPPTVNRPSKATMAMTFNGEGEKAVHPGDWFYVYSQNLPIEFARSVTVDVNGEQIPIATVEHEEYVSDYYRAMDSSDPTRFDISADKSPVIKGYKYKFTFNQNVEGLKNIKIQSTLGNSQQSIAFTKNATVKFLAQVNGETITEQEFTLPAWNSGIPGGYKRTPRNDGSGSYARMNAMVWDARPLSGEVKDRDFMKGFKSDGTLVFNGEVGGMPQGFVATIYPKDTNPNPWTWADTNIVGSRLPVYYMPYDLNGAPQTGNSSDGTTFVTPDNMYAIIEKISADKKTATVRFFGDYSQPGFVVMGTINPDKLPDGKMGTLGVNFDNAEWNPATLPETSMYNEAAIVDANPNSTATMTSTGYKLNMPNPTQGGTSRYGADNRYKASPATTDNPEVLKKGDIIVHYVDTEGNIIKDQVTDTEAEAGNVCKAYDTVVDNRPATIEHGGKTYKLVAKGNYNVGEVLDEGNLLSVKEGNEHAADLKPANAIDGTTPTGEVLQGTHHVTYVYEVAEGSVTINYVDVNGTVIKNPVNDTVDADLDTPYDTTANSADKRPSTITTADGKVYELVPAGDYPVGTVGDDHNVTDSKLKSVIGASDPTGTDPAGKIASGNRHVTYVYKEVKGKVVVNYVDTDGTTIADPATDTDSATYATEYDTADLKPETITTKDGKQYKLVPAGDYTVGTVGKDNNLTVSQKDGVIASEDETGGNPAGTVDKPLTTITYVYEEVKGDVVVRYVDNDGNPLTGGTGKFDGSDKTLTIGSVKAADTLDPDDKDSDYPAAVENTPASSVGTDYNTEGNWPHTIEKDGKIYERVPALTQGKTEGTVVPGTTVITYVYKLKEEPAKTGNVVVHYVDTDGHVLATPVNDTTGADVDTSYDTTDYKPEVITKDGKTYKRVSKAATYPAVGDVNETGLLTAAKDGATGYLAKPADETGKVIDGTLDVTYVYEEVKGDVVVRYVDTEGNPLPGTGTFDGSDKKLTIGELSADKTVDPQDKDYPAAVENTPASSVGTDYTTTENKPNRITTADGKVYELVPALTQGNEEGKVVEGTTVITYVYKEVKGDVNVTYINTDGETIKPSQDVVSQGSVGSDYDSTTEQFKPAKITTADGKVYELAPAATYGEGDKAIVVDENNHKEGSADITGKVTEQLQTVTYVYKEVKGSVTVNYVDEDGNPIKDPQDVEKDKSVGTQYDATTEALKPNTITKDGKTYELVPAGNYGVGLVDENGHKVDSAPVNGKVTEQPQTVTYVYKLKEDAKTGDVKVTYVDVNGKEIKSAQQVAKSEVVGTDYNTTTDEFKPSTIDFEGKTYELVPAGTYTVGQVDNNNHLITSDPITGKVTEKLQTVTYVYREVVKTGNVIIHYVDEQGNTIATDVKDEVNAPVDSDYDTTDHKPQLIDFEGKNYEFVKVKSGDVEKGKVKEGTTEVTYIYKVKEEPQPQPKTGDVIVHYVKQGTDEKLQGDVLDTPASPVDTEYDTTDNKPETIVTTDRDGKQHYWKLVGHKTGSADETGKVVEGTTEVTYEYKEVDAPAPPAGNVIVSYKDTEGKTISPNVVDVIGAQPGSDYDTLSDHRPTTITSSDGTKYELVPAGKDYKVGEVDKDGHLVSSDLVKGEVEANKTKTVTYIYKKVEQPGNPDEPQPKTGDVIVHYVDEDGNKIAGDVVDAYKQPVDDPYDTTDNKPNTIMHDDKTYEFVKVKSGDVEQGKVKEGTTDVTYIYKLKEEPQPDPKTGNVIVHYVDEEGNPIADNQNDETDTPVGSRYDTTDHKPKTITKDGKTYELVKVKDGDKEKGSVVEGDTTVTYIYKLVKTPENPTDPETPQDPQTPETPNNTPKPTVKLPGKSASLARTGVAVVVMVVAAAVAAVFGGVLMVTRRRRNS
ncbi:MucBP domain-containing protein [Alloscardovia omnicolens]|uniref:MucBP domain-containing protein n=1 Tax=Alloscardovia omnicolens TaxID=419015 RepID=UPI003A756B35